MRSLSKHTTIYFEPGIHQALKLVTTSSHSSVSGFVDETVRLLMSEDQDNLGAFTDRPAEKEISYEAMLIDLRKHGKV